MQASQPEGRQTGRLPCRFLLVPCSHHAWDRRGWEASFLRSLVRRSNCFFGNFNKCDICNYCQVYIQYSTVQYITFYICRHSSRNFWNRKRPAAFMPLYYNLPLQRNKTKVKQIRNLFCFSVLIQCL